MSDRLLHRWQLGSRPCNDAILIYVSVKDEKIAVSLKNVDRDSKIAIKKCDLLFKGSTDWRSCVVPRLESSSVEIARYLKEGRHKEAITKTLSILAHTDPIELTRLRFCAFIFVIVAFLYMVCLTKYTSCLLALCVQMCHSCLLPVLSRAPVRSISLTPEPSIKHVLIVMLTGERIAPGDTRMTVHLTRTGVSSA